MFASLASDIKSWMRASYWYQMAKLAAGMKRKREREGVLCSSQIHSMICHQNQKHKVRKHSQPGKVNECQIEKQINLFNSKMILYCNCLSLLSLLLVCDQPDSRNSILLYLSVLTRMFEFAYSVWWVDERMETVSESAQTRSYACIIL